MKIFNRKASYGYELLDSLEAGISLYGYEVKAVKEGGVDINASHIKINGSEAYLVGAKIRLYKFASPEGYDPQRTRKLLLHKKEIIALKSRMEGSGLTLIPVSIYTNRDNLIKVEIALARGKKKYQKKESIKKRDLERELETDFGI